MSTNCLAGQQEVVQGVQDARSNINQMIMALAHRVDGDPNPSHPQLTSPRASEFKLHLTGSLEGLQTRFVKNSSCLSTFVKHPTL